MSDAGGSQPRPETKSGLRRRLQAEGRWPEALAYREGLKRQGVEPREAHRRTAARFQPLDGTRTAYRPHWRASEPKPGGRSGGARSDAA